VVGESVVNGMRFPGRSVRGSEETTQDILRTLQTENQDTHLEELITPGRSPVQSPPLVKNYRPPSSLDLYNHISTYEIHRSWSERNRFNPMILVRVSDVQRGARDQNNLKQTVILISWETGRQREGRKDLLGSG